MPILSATTQRPGLTRRAFLRGMLGTALTIGGAVGYSRTLEPRWLATDEVQLAIAGLPDALAGYRIAQLSDIHLGPFSFNRANLVEVMDQVAAANVAQLFLTGDYVSRDVSAVTWLIEPLRTLDLPITAVVGNHDIWTHVDTVTTALGEAGVTVLRNDAVPIATELWVAGVDDVWSGRPDLQAALREVPPGATTLLLAHEPDYFDTVLRANAPIAAQFSGHTHGGQVRFPTWRGDGHGNWTFAPILPRYGERYPIGLRTIGARHVYTNRGLGVWPVPYRLNCRPELTIYTLVPAA